jgi:hypothetical protein
MNNPGTAVEVGSIRIVENAPEDDAMPGPLPSACSSRGCLRRRWCVVHSPCPACLDPRRVELLSRNQKLFEGRNE